MTTRFITRSGWILATACLTACASKTTKPPRPDPYYVNYMPFGAGQFQNGERAKGAALAIIQCAAVTTSAGAWLYLNTAYQGDIVPAGEASTARTIRAVEVTTGFVFFGTYALGVIDALVNYRARMRVTPTMVGGAPGVVWSW